MSGNDALLTTVGHRVRRQIDVLAAGYPTRVSDACIDGNINIALRAEGPGVTERPRRHREISSRPKPILCARDRAKGRVIARQARLSDGLPQINRVSPSVLGERELLHCPVRQLNLGHQRKVRVGRDRV